MLIRKNIAGYSGTTNADKIGLPKAGMTIGDSRHYLRHSPLPAHPEPVGAYAEDTSPYGVCDLAGGVREWCETPATSKGADVRHLRGGSWLHGSTAARCCSRMGDMTDAALYIYGFRLCTTELLAV